MAKSASIATTETGQNVNALSQSQRDRFYETWCRVHARGYPTDRAFGEMLSTVEGIASERGQGTGGSPPTTTAGNRGKRRISAEGKRKIAEAQRRRRAQEQGQTQAQP